MKMPLHQVVSSRFLSVCLLSCLVLAQLCLASCGGSYAPRGWLPRGADAIRTGYGAYVRVEMMDRNIVEGEALATTADTIYVLEQADTGFVTSAARANIFYLEGDYYDVGTAPQVMSMLTTIGSVVSLFSVGFYSLIAIPLYLAAGLTDANATAHQSRFSYYGDDNPIRQQNDWRIVASYSRFPGALPPNFPRVRVPTGHSIIRY